MLACSFVGFHIANKLGTVDGGAANNQLPVVRPAAALWLMRRQGGQLLREGELFGLGTISAGMPILCPKTSLLIAFLSSTFLFQ